jgi:ABC-type Fe3+ transport system substrate-binding protein
VHIQPRLWRYVAGLAALVLVACAPAPPATPAGGAAPTGATQPGSPEGQRLLNELVARARQEGGELSINTTTELGEVMPELTSAFNKRFGLNVRISAQLGDQPARFAQAMAQLQAGLAPSIDVYAGSEGENIRLIQAGYGTRIDHWEELLAEINPIFRSGEAKFEDVSPGPFAGYSFIWTTRNKALLYNTRLISEADLPKTYPEIADPKYRGKYPVAPFTDQWELGLLTYKDKDAWLNTVDQVGRNAADVISYSPALDRIVLGEFAFMPSETFLWVKVKAKDPQAPLGHRHYDDYTPYSRVFHAVPKGSKHPALGTLWSLWMTTTESEHIWQPVSFQPNLAFGQTDLDKQIRDGLKRSGSRVVSFYDSPETLDVLAWYGTEEGKQYQNRIVQAITQRKR